MRKIQISLLCTILLSPLICLNYSYSIENDMKFYVTPGSVYVASDAIYVNYEGTFIPVESIAVDECGVYINDLNGERPQRILKCSSCQRTWNTSTQQSQCPHNPK